MTLERCIGAKLVGTPPSDLSTAALDEVSQVDNRKIKLPRKAEA
jgi:hypothetical protein